MKLIKSFFTILAAFFLTYGVVYGATYFVEGDLKGSEPELGASVLKVYQGGTGATSFTAGQCLVGNGTGAVTTAACGSGGSGGSSIWSTTTPDLILYYNGGKPLIVGGTATTSANTVFEIIGASQFDNANFDAAVTMDTTLNVTGKTTLGFASTTQLTATTLYGTLSGDLTCTDCLNATEIEDVYVLNTGDNVSGNLNVSGNVGIGTTTPKRIFHVEGGSAFGINTLTAGNSGMVNVELHQSDDYTQALKLYADRSGVDTLYGFNGTAVGANTTNVGLYGWASGATNNLGLLIDSGNAQFDENVLISGKLTAENASSTGITATNFWGTLNGAVSSDATWTLHNNYPAACGAGEYVSAIGDTLTCATPANTTYTAGNGLLLVGTSFSINAGYANTFTAKQTLNGGASTTLLTASTLYPTNIVGFFGSDCAAGNYAYGINADGTLDCRADTTGSGAGGSSIWSTSTLLYYYNGGNSILIGGAATTSNVLFEVIGASQFDNANFDAAVTMDTTLNVTGKTTLGLASTTQLTATTLYGTLSGDLTCTDCINATEIEDIYVLTAGDSMTGQLTLANNLIIDDGTNPSPYIRLVDDADAYTEITHVRTGGFKIDTSEPINFYPSGDDDDYFTFTTTSNVPILGTAGGANLKITADGGTVDFDNENLTTTGGITVASYTGADTISTSALQIIDTAADNEVLSFDKATGQMEWTAAGSGDFSLATWFATTSAKQLTTIGDVGCTDCLNATEIEDIYLLTAGDSMSGKLTMTYASSTGITATSFWGTLYGDATGVSAGAIHIADLASEDFGGFTCNGSACTIDDGTVAVAKLASADFGDFTCNGTACTVDNGVIAIADLASADFGGFTCNGSTCTVDSDGAWTAHNSYPDACATGVVTGIGDTLTCTATSTLQINAADLTCTDCIGTTEIADSYLLNDGDVGTGVFDFGGATSFEIVNGASPTVDAAGETAIDTTSDQFIFYGGAKRVLAYWQEKCFTVASTTFNNYDNIPLWHPTKAIEVTNVYCKTDGGTSVAMTLSDGTNALEAITCDADGQADDGSIANGTFTARERFEVDFGTVTGTVNWLNVCVTYNITAD